MPLVAGTRLGRYEVLGLIGAGGMGEVYRARDTRLLRTVAIKVLPPQLAADPSRRQRFEREARAASALEHPHICTLYDVGSEGERDFLVLEHLQGETLAARLARGRLAREEGLCVGMQIADALDAAHRKGIVHRDLKPANVMLTASGVKLLDFGLAHLTEERSADQETTALRLSAAGTVAGTVPYMSPEQLMGATVDARTDIWALGVLLYEMLSGRRPFEGASVATVMVAILQHDPPPLSSAEPLVPPALEHVVSRCLARDPRERWQTARDVASELGWLSEGPGTARTPAPPRATAVRARRWQAWTLRVAAVPALAALALAAWWWHSRTPKAAPDPKRIFVAVFENRTGDATLEPLGRTLADHVSNGLTRLEGVQVLPRGAGAGLLVSGIYTLAGEELRVQARLSDGRTGQFQALEPTVGPRGAPMTAVEAVRQRVMGAVAVRIDPGWLGAADDSPPTYDAYREFQVAQEGGPEFIVHLRRAAETDPDFAWAGMQLIGYSFVLRDYPGAARHVASLEERRTRLSARQRLFLQAFRSWLAGQTGEAYLAAREARKLQPADPVVAFTFSWFAQNAYRFREAVEALTAPLDWTKYCATPRTGGAYFFNLTQMLHELGEHERELEQARRGQRLHPELSWLRDREAQALAALGRLAEMERVVAARAALGSARQRGSFLLYLGLELRAHGQREASVTMLARAREAFRGCSLEEARTPEVRADLAQLERLAGRLEESAAIYDRLARETPADSEMALVRAGDRGVVAALRGRRPQALRISDELGRVARPYLFGVHDYERARIAAELGEMEQAVDLLRQAIGQGFILSIESNGLHLEPSFETLRGYPPFAELVRPQ